MSYSVKHVALDNLGNTAIFLVSKSGRDFLTEWSKDKRTRETAKRFVALFVRIKNVGVNWALKSSKARVIDGKVGLLEIKNFDDTWRVLCYFHVRTETDLVLLEEFKGHSGSAKIPPSILARCTQKAAIAKGLLEADNDKGI